MNKKLIHLEFDYKAYFFRLVLSVLLAVGVYSAVDFWTLRVWNVKESLVVEILGVGNEKILSSEDDQNDGPFQTLEIDLLVRILTGDQKGRNFPVAVTQMEGTRIEFLKGRRYILFWDTFEDGSMQYSIADLFRIPSVLGGIVFACACLIAFAGRSGIRALLGLGLSMFFLLWGYIPLVAKGYPPLPLAFIVVVLISIVTVFCVVKRKRTRLVALLGTLGGVAGAFFLGYLMVELWQLNGLAAESASLLVTTIPNMDIRGLLLAAVAISAIGAVLDVGISITAAMSELFDYDPEISPLQLWTSGIRVGSEMLGTMINTLILAYLGTSLPVSILISNAGVDLWGLLNDPYVGQEIVHSLAGTSGLLLTIPITATFFVLREKYLHGNFSTWHFTDTAESNKDQDDKDSGDL